MTNKTVLHAKHIEAGAKLVDFYGWEMPINYGSQIEEHHAVRTAAGMFDVSLNLLNNEFRALPGLPKIGRTATARLLLDL